MAAKKTTPYDNVYFVREVVVPYKGRKFYARAVGAFGSTDVLLVFDEIQAGSDDMGASDNAHEKEAAVAAENNDAKKEDAGDSKPKEKGEPKNKSLSCLKILFVMLGVIAVVVSIALIIVAILTCIATRAYDADQSSRIAAMVLLAVTGAFSVCMVIYLEVAIFRRQKRPMIGCCATIMILIIVQALIGGICVNVQPSDEAKLVKSLTESFKLAKEEIPRHYRLWATTQYDLTCCGMYGPEDYRSQKQPYYFPPDVPISCCSNYDASRSDLVQERERQLCKNTKIFHQNGCKDLVLVVFNETAAIVLTVNVIVIIIQIILLIVAVVLSRKLKNIDNHQVQVSPK